jgi:hypothetical protein
MIREFEEFMIIVAGPYIFTGWIILMGLSIFTTLIKLLWGVFSILKERRL